MENWPVWAAVTVAILIQLKMPIQTVLSKLLPGHFGHLARLEEDQQDFEQEKERALLQARLEESRTARQNQMLREDRVMELLEGYHEFAQQLVLTELKELRLEMARKFEQVEAMYLRGKKRETTQSKLYKLIEK